MGLQILPNGLNGDVCRSLQRKMVDASTDRRECDGLAPECRCLRKAIAIAGSQKLVFVRFTAAPDWSRRMDNIPAGQAIRFGCLGFAGGTAAKRAALCQKFRSCGTMDRAVHTAAAQQRGVRSIDNRVRLAFGDVALDDFQPFHKHAFFQGDLLDLLYIRDQDKASLTVLKRYVIIKTE